MNDETDKLDDLFRKGLEDPVDPSYRETDWESFQQMLDGEKKRRGIVYWLPVLSAVAALLLVFLGWWLFVPKAGHSFKAQQAVIHRQTAPATKIEKSERQPESKQASPDFKEYVKNQRENKRNNINKGNRTPPAAPGVNTHPDDAGGDQDDVHNRQFAETLTAVSDKPVIGQSANAYQVNAIDISGVANSRVKGADMSKNERNKLKIKPAFRPQFALTVLAAPDVSGVGSFQQSKLGTNVGLSFSAGVSRKFTISTGVVYSDKPYLTGFGNYHTRYKFPTAPENVNADCRMLDIPINISYQVYHKNRNTLSFGTGLSSYIMMDQNYEFNYSDPYAFGPKTFHVVGNDKYLFEILNLTASYQHQLNSKVGLSVQPYFKLPLANIAYGQVRLQTTGVAIGLTWNFNSIAKN